MTEPTDLPIPGAHALDHTADVGLALEAATLEALVERAALGMAWLLLERPAAGPRTERRLQVSAPDAPALLREALRELLWWHEAEGLTVAALDAVQVRADAAGLTLSATATLAADPEPPVREIKGVTLHGLAAERRDGTWHGGVVFDV